MTGRRAGCTRTAPTASWPLGSAEGCPVQRECLELELRMFGEQTVGVWGALGEDDRRALVPLWRRRPAIAARPAIGAAPSTASRVGGER